MDNTEKMLADALLQKVSNENSLLYTAVNLLDESIRSRFILILSGAITKKELLGENLPAKVRDYDKKTCYKTGYNFLTDEVSYEYESLITRYFKSVEERDSALKENRWYIGLDEKNEEHLVMGETILKQTGKMSSDTWLYWFNKN